jgi:hypothetical protein
MIKYEVNLDSMFVGSHLVAGQTLAYDSSGSADIDVRVFLSLVPHAPRRRLMILLLPKYNPAINTQSVPYTSKPEIHNVCGSQ